MDGCAGIGCSSAVSETEYNAMQYNEYKGVVISPLTATSTTATYHARFAF